LEHAGPLPVPQIVRLEEGTAPSRTRFLGNPFQECSMNARNTARTLALSGAALMLLAGAAQAGSSSRSEREATRQLNLQASQAAQTSQPQEAVKDAAANVADNTPPAAAPTLAVQTADMSAAPSTPLASISNPPSIIATANVLDNSGQTIGAVQKVEVSSSGNPTHVVVALIGKQEHLVVLDAATLSYDAGKNQITAQASAAAIQAMGNAG
jgi:hypothetical protein